MTASSRHRGQSLSISILIALASLCFGLGGCGKKEEPVPTRESPSVGNSEAPRWIYRDPAKPSRVAVVFVHGIFGGTTSTWTNSQGQSFFKFLKEDPKVGSAVDVYAFGFESKMFAGGKGSLDVREAANVLKTYLSNADVLSYDTVVFVGHSMGGLVTLRYLASSLPSNAELAAKIPLVVLFGAPQEGADLASIGQLASFNPGLISMKPVNDNQWLQQLLEDWLTVKKLPKNPKVVCGYEKATTYNFMVVPWNGSTRLCTEAGVAIGGADHLSIVKPDSADHSSVVLLVEALRPYTGARAAKLETPDFVQEGNSWKVTMDKPDKEVRVMNLGKSELSYWVAEAKGSGLIILPNEVKKIAGDEEDKIRMLLLLGAGDSEYSFYLKTKHGEDRWVTVAPDFKRIRAATQASRDELVASLNAHLDGTDKGKEPQAELVEVAAQQIDKKFPGLPEGARWLVTADALSAASLEPASSEALKRAARVSPELAANYEVQKISAPRFKELDQKILFPGDTKGPKKPIVIDFDPKASNSLAPLSEQSLKDYSELANRLKSTRGLEGNGHLLDARLRASTGDFDAARKSIFQAREFDGAAEIRAAPLGQSR